MTLGIVGESALADWIRDAAEPEADVAHASASEVVAADPESVVAVGESALLAVGREGPDAPVLPVNAGPGYGGVSLDASDSDISGDDSDSTDSSTPTKAERERLSSALDALLAREFETDSRTLLAVTVDGERVGPALADVMLVTAEPARISEYAVRSRGERVARFRADGVVVSTPTGSHGYGRSAGGPLLEPGSGVVGVVPVAPFAVNVDHWVLSADRPVTLTVERDEGEVSLLLDDRTVRRVSPHTAVEVVEDGSLDVVRVTESRPFFER
ncbi:NAD(+)/NADH kinase [Halorussus sp. MSC15.2]|uniref:NAD(+)/NADH kinase n=1 Tax=Halorussus sp. MSC15.2 TaxID=2283638 RepID=UPI0013D8D363|nr:NAD(+)/NADH kinase [Halorussus sp. MSC15.2]NEU56620.1 ATP-NAD kinase [Halorussus sp. MSC15.2]